MTRVCNTCKIEKDLSCFGNGRLFCKQCYNIRYSKKSNCLECGKELVMVCTSKVVPKRKCHSCASKEFLKRPEVIKKKSDNAREQVLRQGGVPNARKFTTENTKEKHHNWKGGISTEIQIARGGVSIRNWKKSVFERDNYTCRRCLKNDKKLNAHHIYDFINYPDKRFDITNGVTLCVDCHRSVHRAIKLFKRAFLTIVFLFTFGISFCQSSTSTFWQMLKKSAPSPPPTLKAFTVDTVLASSLDLLTPQRGANTFFTNTQWANVPDPAVSTWSIDNYYRFLWVLVETGNGVFNWTDFNNQVNTSISRRQRFEFRVETLDTDAPGVYTLPNVGGAFLVYPQFLHTQMQAETLKDWSYNNGSFNVWIPNWNSPSYLSAWQTFCVALNNHIMITSFNGVPYSSVISKIDIAGFGNYSEWHSFPFINSYPNPGQVATTATLNQIIDIHLAAYPQWPAMGNINMFVGEVPAATGYHAFFSTNLWGRIGILNDHFGWTATYNNDVPNNTRNFNGVVFGTQIQIQYQVAPIAGEPMNSASAVTTGGPCAFWHMQTEILAYHASQFNNQNGTGVSGACVNANYLASSKSCGYKVKMKSGTVSTNIPKGGNLQLNLIWGNSGIAPNYENWQVRVDLRNAGGTVVFTGQSGFLIKFFQPGVAPVFTDNFNIPTLPTGTYSVRVTVIDPLAYRAPLPLYNTNPAADGSYLLTTIALL